MKKLTLLFATLVLSFTAQAVTHNVSSSFSWWVAGTDSPVQAGDTLLVADGEYVEQWSIDFQKSDLVVMAAEGAKPVIKASSYLKIHATTTFEGITFDGLNTATYAIGSRGTEEKNLTLKNCEFKNYVDCDIYIYESTSINKLTIDSCVFDGTNTTPIAIYGKGSTSELTITNSEFKNYTEYCITANDYYKGYFEKVSISNSLFHDSKYSAIYLYQATEGNPQSCTDFQLTNSTIYNIGNNPTETDLPKRAVVEIRGNSTQQVLVDHVTIYNFPAPDYCGAIKIENSSNATISNCIVMNPDDIYTKWITPFLAYAGATISNSVYYNCNITSSATATQEDLTQADPMFVDAANADFMLYAESPAIGMGDPRWGVKAGLKPGAEVLSKAVAAAAPGATIILGDGIYEESYSFDFDEEGLTIVAAEGTNPVIKTTGEWTSLGIVASTTFDGITFDGGNLTKTSLNTKGTAAQTLTLRNCEFKSYTDYNINVAENTTINTITIDNCEFDGVKATKAAILAKGIVTTCTIEDSEFKNYAEYCITANNYYRGRIDGLSINNCLLHDGAVAVYMPKYADEGTTQTCAIFSLTNSTIYNMVGTKWEAVIDIRSNPEAEEALNKVVIDHITLYNFTTTELGGITSRKSTDAKITNSIIANPADNTNQYAYRVYGAAAVQNTLCFNTKRSGGNSSNPLDVDPLFVDAANSNFDLYANSPAVGAGTDGSTLGDPRWGVSASLKGKVINIEPGQQTLATAVGYSVSPGDTIVLADGTYEEPYSFNFDVEGLVVMAAEGAKPEIILTDAGGNANLKLDNSTTFDGITFSGSNISKYLIITNGTDASKFIFNNCEFKNYLNYAISDPWTDNYDNGRHVDSILINNCLFHDGGAAINLSKYGPEGKHTCDYFEMKNSTIYNISNTGNAAILVSSNNESTGAQNKVVLDHITIYNYANASYGAIAIRKSSDLQITNSIIANPTSGLYAFYIYGGTINNTLYYNAVDDSDAAYSNCLTADPLFVDAANANFTLQATSPAIGAGTDGSNLGDPRWGVEEPAFITLTTGDNSAVIAANINKTVDVVIERSFKANDGYYTLCVPFNMDPSVIGEAYYLGNIKKHVSGQGIDIELVEEKNMLSAGVPYLVLPKADMTQLVVEDVTILEDPAAGQNITSDELNVQIFFQGYYSAGGQTNGTTEYYVGNNGHLYNGKVEIRGLSGLFTITDTEGNPTKVRARVVAGENEVTGVEDIITNDTPQKVIENGQLIIIRNGLKYNVQGQRL